MTYLTTSQTPVYKPGTTGFYTFVRSVPAGTEIVFTGTAMDPRSNRTVGLLPGGEVMYTDTLTRVLDNVQVQDTRLWDWLLWLGAAGVGIYLLNKPTGK